LSVIIIFVSNKIYRTFTYEVKTEHTLFRFSNNELVCKSILFCLSCIVFFIFRSRGNADKDVYKETKRAKQPPYPQGPAGGGKNRSGGVPIENVSNNEYGQVEIERLVNRHQRGNREHTEKQQAEAAVHQHFEESLKLAQQQRVRVSINYSTFFFYNSFSVYIVIYFCNTLLIPWRLYFKTNVYSSFVYNAKSYIFIILLYFFSHFKLMSN